MAIVVDEILNAEIRPNWLHPAMFHGPLTSAICSLPPIRDDKAILMPPTIDPREVYWSKFSICNHSRPLERKPFIVSLRYHPPFLSQTLQNNHKISPSKSGSGTTPESSSAPSINDGLTTSAKKHLATCRRFTKR
ncbi:hypothetical protein LOAG_13110 [Loa loa]|uniref:Uncharacterized protein n=1 Tax=Loa loa TaxID=7209 RepID=A0A1S0TKH6_LOALO|nr:hypothetical protein LOAG_13110 [Loa loa]EFO15400.1 hypothetical protein LOAG_13110 [Loa loa]